MTHGDAGSGGIHRLIGRAWSAKRATADPDDPLVRGFADFGLPSSSPLVRDSQLPDLKAWRRDLHITANSAFVDGTLLLTVEALLGDDGPNALTPVTLWELTAFIDALLCFDRLYCIANPVIDVSRFNRRLGEDVLTVIPDPDGGMLRRLAVDRARSGLSDIKKLRTQTGPEDVYKNEKQAVVDAWRTVLGEDFPGEGLFNMSGIDTRLARMRAPAATPDYGPDPSLLAAMIDGPTTASGEGPVNSRAWQLRVIIEATRVPQPSASSTGRPPLKARKQLAATATYRTYVNQGIATALGLPYMPGTLRMPFRRQFIKRACDIQDELVTVAQADKNFAQQQPDSQLILPFFTAALLRQAITREDIWSQMAHMREQSVSFRQKRADLDRILEDSHVSREAQRVLKAIGDDALRLRDVAGAAQQAASTAIGVVAATPAAPLVTAGLPVAVNAASGLNRDGSWTRIWRRLFQRHLYFLAQTNSQAIELTNALPKIEKLWEMPKIGGYLDHFADATKQMGQVLRG
jgi:hypothetical protein